MARPKKIKTPYKAQIKVMGRIFSSEGETPKEALENLKPLGTAKGIGILTISSDKKTSEKILTSPQIFRLFNGSQFSREVAIKQTLMRFDI